MSVVRRGDLGIRSARRADAGRIGRAGAARAATLARGERAGCSALAQAQSADMAQRLSRRGRADRRAAGAGWAAPDTVIADGRREPIEADAVLIATGALPRVLPGAEPDGERILNWRSSTTCPSCRQHLIVVGSGVTGAEFASAYQALGSQVTLVSVAGPGAAAARTRTPPRCSRTCSGAAAWRCCAASRAAAVERTGDGVLVTLDRRPDRPAARTACWRSARCRNTAGLGLEEAGVALDDRGLRRGRPGLPDHGPRASTRPATAPAC